MPRDNILDPESNTLLVGVTSSSSKIKLVLEVDEGDIFGGDTGDIQANGSWEQMLADFAIFVEVN